MRKNLFIIFLLGLVVLTSCEDQMLDIYKDGKVYNLRDRGPAGGWIFYINPNWEADGWRYLEAAPEDQSTGTAWSTPINNTTGATGTGIGTGKSNTIAIINATSSSAAKNCADYTYRGYNDWFLPSLDEAYCMYLNMVATAYPIGGFVNGVQYWTSTEISNTNSYFVIISTSYKAGLSKNFSTVYVRPIRRF
ncbi:MAG: hypothetical protein JW982_06310 [Spirochaetes bacterium]|nr:hypothetical protein [Spirochaetota bacterium]